MVSRVFVFADIVGNYIREMEFPGIGSIVVHTSIAAVETLLRQASLEELPEVFDELARFCRIEALGYDGMLSTSAKLKAKYIEHAGKKLVAAAADLRAAKKLQSL